MLALVFLLKFVSFWYIYGCFSLFVAIRYGFGPAIVTNFYILLTSYVLPKLFGNFGKNYVGDYIDVNNLFLGANFLFVFAIVTGKVISDLKDAEAKLTRQNQELKQINEELDRFVYSVSHDLSAPLKSILGLVNISRISDNLCEQKNYLDKIETSVQKAEKFITEILDYSRNKRQDIVAERIELKPLCDEILNNLHTNIFNEIRIDFDLLEPEMWQDKSRIKIILNNILSNAVNFQKKHPGHQPYIKITSRRTSEHFLIQIEDNGEGIKSEQLHRIFNMFYRGHEKSTGSGLGLYIAREAALKINGTLSVKSEYGKGSVFEVQLKDLKYM